MSHIQKILERAERDGSIRPAPLAPEPMRPAPSPAPSELHFDAPSAPFIAPSVPPAAPPPPAPAPVHEAYAPAAPSAAPSIRRVEAAGVDRRLLEALRPGSTVAEQYRALRTRLQLSANGRGLHALMVTSPGRGEGRTQTAAGLAITMAQEPDRRVCLVDADLHHPHLREVFGLPDGPGLSDVLAGRVPLEEALVHIDALHLTVLPGADAAAQMELLGGAAMRRMMQALRVRFDRIVVDAPAATPVADVALLTPLVDGLMLVVRSGVTTKPAIHQAVDSIASDKLLGVVLNDAR